MKIYLSTNVFGEEEEEYLKAPRKKKKRMKKALKRRIEEALTKIMRNGKND